MHFANLVILYKLSQTTTTTDFHAHKNSHRTQNKVKVTFYTNKHIVTAIRCHILVGPNRE